MVIATSVHSDVALAFQSVKEDFSKNFLHGALIGVKHLRMPNQRAKGKVFIGCWVSVAFKQRFAKVARSHKMKPAEYLAFLIYEATKNVELSPEDYEQLAQEAKRSDRGPRNQGGKKSA